MSTYSVLPVRFAPGRSEARYHAACHRIAHCNKDDGDCVGSASTRHRGLGANVTMRSTGMRTSSNAVSQLVERAFSASKFEMDVFALDIAEVVQTLKFWVKMGWRIGP